MFYFSKDTYHANVFYFSVGVSSSHGQYILVHFTLAVIDDSVTLNVELLQFRQLLTVVSKKKVRTLAIAPLT